MTVFGLVIVDQLALKKEFHLVNVAVLNSVFMLFRIILANFEESANLDSGADLFKDLTLKRLVQAFTVLLPTAGQDSVGSVAIFFPQHQQFAILDDDSFNRIAQFSLLFHGCWILPQNWCTSTSSNTNQQFSI